jgi:hypothetical protein
MARDDNAPRTNRAYYCPDHVPEVVTGKNPEVQYKDRDLGCSQDKQVENFAHEEDLEMLVEVFGRYHRPRGSHHLR